MKKEIKTINDHIMMVQPGGKKPKAVPCWQIRQWIQLSKFDLGASKGNAIGWDFVNPEKGCDDYAIWQREEARKEAIAAAKMRLGATPAPAGIAGAAHDAAVREASGSVFGTPDAPPVPDPPAKSEPKDVI